ncbi:MAG: PAS domain S-box protein [Desulfosarcinaceae bacterium]|nr:PAS domain S-box protein [Desulfosarcinaceae bacterium]
MHLNRLTLRFSGPDRRLEPDYQSFRYTSSVGHLRLCHLLAILAFSTAAILDISLFAEQFRVLLTIRIGIVLMFLLGLVTTRAAFYRYTWEWQNIFYVLATGFAAMGFIAIAPLPDSHIYYISIIVSLIFGYTFIHCSFVKASLAGTLLLAAYAAQSTWLHPAPPGIRVNNLYILGIINMLGMIIAYSVEHGARAQFYLTRRLENERAKVADGKDLLEKRVLERTEQLSAANERLRMEIDERRRTAEALKDSDEKFGKAFQASPMALIIRDEDTGKVVDVNDKFLSLLGYSEEMVIGNTTLGLGMWADPAEREAFLMLFSKGERVKNFRCRFRRSNGQFGVGLISAERIHLKGRAFMLAILNDVSELEEIKASEQESRQRMAAVFAAAATSIVIIDAEAHTIVDANPAALELLGLSAETVVGSPCHQFICPQFDGQCPMEMEGRLAEQATGREQEITNVDGEKIPVLRKTVRTTIHGRPHYITSIVNLSSLKEAESERKTLEARLHQSQRLEAIGTLAGGIAHDFNNMLASIMGFTELSIDDAQSNPDLVANLQEVLNAGRRAKDLIQQILAFSRERDQDFRPMAMRPVINEALKLLRASLPTTIEIQTDLEKIDPIKGDPTQIHQVLMNLATNAGHSMRTTGGLLHVRLSQRRLEREFLRRHPDLPPGQYALLEVADTGTGMTTAVVERIYDPFFTTKDKSEGTGLGLSVVHGIIKTHQGAITVESKPGEGTTFRIYLPTIQQKARKEAASAPVCPTGTEHILVVDDEPQVLKMCASALERLGYQVTARGNPSDALRLFCLQPQAFDLLLTDMTMPGFTGDKLAGEVHRYRGDLPVILFTGFSESLSEEIRRQAGIHTVLSKPILRHQLAVAVRQTLDAQHRPHSVSA